MAENIILQSTNNELTLTDKRVIFDAKGGGKSEYMSIPLDQIAHSGLKTSENMFVLVCAVLAAALALVMFSKGDQRWQAAAAAAAVAFFGYVVTKKKRIVISSVAGGEISVPATAGDDEIRRFLRAVEDQRMAFR